MFESTHIFVLGQQVLMMISKSATEVMKLEMIDSPQDSKSLKSHGWTLSISPQPEERTSDGRQI